jgi:predicted nucleic acid-binding protein
MSGSFVDTNIVVYAAVDEPEKAGRANGLLEHNPHTSVQVLNEFASVAKGSLGWSWPRIESFLEGVEPLVTIHPTTLAIHESGRRLADRYGFDIYDALIVAAALEAGCDTLYSEDMQHGLLVDNQLRVTNPFA